MKFDVEYKLEFNLRKEIINIKNLILSHITNSEIYLFGSIAKGCYTKNSDIDILILVNDNKSLKELRNLRHFIEDEIENLRLNRKTDIKIYNKDRYTELATVPSFENVILNDLIDLRSW